MSDMDLPPSTVVPTAATTTAAAAFRDLLIPRHATGAADFCSAPSSGTSSTGRGCVMGILDTGIDPAAHRFCSSDDDDDGVTPKLLNVIDCTGSGDVHLSGPVDLSVDAPAGDDDDYRTVTGLSGRTLRVPKAWKIQPFPESKMEGSSDPAATNNVVPSSTTDNPLSPANVSLPVRLGVKRGYELFPGPLTARVKEERQKQFQLHTAAAVSQLREQMAQWKLQYSRDGGDNHNATSSDTTKKQKPTANQLLDYQDWQAQLDLLARNNNAEDDSSSGVTIQDPGPVYDCLVFWDGTHYRAAVDVHETGDLRQVQPLAAFGVERQYGTFGTAVEQLNFAVQFYRHGNLLSLVCDCSPHGTHVAGIATAMAPDAQIVSFKIGEPRLRGMETGPSLARALRLAPQYHCDVINLSYGEPTQVPNAGNFVRQAERLVYQDGVIFVAAAGNQGPALSTASSPGSTTAAVIGVAAHVSPSMHEPLYGHLEEENDEKGHQQRQQWHDTLYTWSSTGPAIDGDFGVSVSAPGGAVASVPHWCLQKTQLMNGTSMASPSCTGCVALLISACKSHNVPVSPAAVRRALENTAVPVSEHLSPLQQGWGLINVGRAWEYLQANQGNDTEDILFQVAVIDRPGSPRGIYLRQADESSVRQTFTVQVKPQFPREDVVSDKIQKRKINMEMHFNLQCTASWVQIPTSMTLSSAGNSVNVQVDPTGLQPGVHTARVCGYEIDKPSRKILFAIPITVIKPILPAERDVAFGALDFGPAEVKRFFVVPPPGATWMDVTLRDGRDSSTDFDSRVVGMHTVQLLPHAAFREHECSKRLSLMPGQTSVSSIAVEAGYTCEIALAKYWSTRGTTKFEASVCFRGIRPVPRQVNFVAGSGGAMIRIHSDLDSEMVNPAAKLIKWQTPLRPKTNGIVTPLIDERDMYPSTDRKTYQLLLTYEFEQEEKGSFTPRAPALNGVLYESGFESQMFMVFDGDKKCLGMSDAYPARLEAPKGTVVLRLEVRHDDPSKLEKLKDIVIWIERDLSKEIPLSIYTTRENMMLEKDTFRKRTLRKGTSCAVFIGEPHHSKFPTACAAGDRLLGSVTYGAGDSVLPGEGKRPGGFPVSFDVGPKPSKESLPEAAKPEPTMKPTVHEKLNDAIRDIKIEHLGKLTTKDKEEGKFDELYTMMEQDYPDHLPLRMAKLKYLDTHEKRSEMLEEVAIAADAVIRRISDDELALNLGRKVDDTDGDALKEREEITEKKNMLVEALALQILAYAEMENASDKLDQSVIRLKRWVDIESETKFAVLNIEEKIRSKHYGLALKQVNQLLAKNGVKDYKKDLIKPSSRNDLLKKRGEILAMLGFTLLVEYDQLTRAVDCPKQYAPF